MLPISLPGMDLKPIQQLKREFRRRPQSFIHFQFSVIAAESIYLRVPPIAL